MPPFTRSTSNSPTGKMASIWRPIAPSPPAASLLERAVAGDMHLMAFHFPFPSIGKVAATPEGGWQWTPGW